MIRIDPILQFHGKPAALPTDASNAEQDLLQEQIRQAINEAQIESEAKGQKFFDAASTHEELHNSWKMVSNSSLHDEEEKEVQAFIDKEEAEIAKLEALSIKTTRKQIPVSAEKVNRKVPIS